MSDIVEAVAKAIAQKQLDEGDGLYDWYALTDEVADGYREMARAAIEAYEAAKVVKVWPTVDYFNGVPVSQLSDAEMVEYRNYLRGGYLDRVGKP